MTPFEQVHESVLKLLGVGPQEFVWVVGEYEELPLVRLAGRVALEPVLVTALLLAHLAVPAELLQSLGLHLVGQVLDGTLFGLRHLEAGGRSPKIQIMSLKNRKIPKIWGNSVTSKNEESKH